VGVMSERNMPACCRGSNLVSPIKTLTLMKIQAGVDRLNVHDVAQSLGGQEFDQD
jgi:hypothetical protein